MERDVKRKVHEACLVLLEEKIGNLLLESRNYQSAANEETKSTAGDKYETSRAMMHLEKEKIAAQLDQLRKQEKVLRQLNPEKRWDAAVLGSLIRTDHGVFYLSISLGCIRSEFFDEVFCISPVAPLGQALQGCRPGSRVSFGGRVYQVLDLF